jgi:hypothetical protein
VTGGATMEKPRRFSEEERQAILNNWWDVERRERICKRFNRTNGSCSFEYYRMLRKMGISPSEHKMSMTNMQEQIIPVKQNILDNKELMISQFENLIFLLKQKEPINVSALIQEKNRLQSDFALLKMQYEAAKAQLEDEKEISRKILEELNFYLGQFFGLSSVEKLASLRDFLPKIKTVVDKYGTVIEVVREGDMQNFLAQAASDQ